MTTTRAQVKEAAEQNGDTLEALDCFYTPTEGQPLYYFRDPDVDDPEAPALPALIRCRGDELPTREYSAGYGGVEGEPVVCFSERYVYFRHGYDGAETIESVPRHPAFVTEGVLIGA